MVEEARIRINTLTRYRDGPTADDLNTMRAELVSFLNKFNHSKDVDPAVLKRRFVLGPMMPRERENTTVFLSYFLPSQENSATIEDALLKFSAYVESLDFSFLENQGALTFEDLGRIVPRQQVAPVQFDVIDGRIVLANRTPTTIEADRLNISSALEHIRGSGDLLIQNLDKSNCDRRLLANVKELQDQLALNGNIIKIGLTNLACGIMGSQFTSELPDAIVAMLTSYTASISLYVSQFPEWDQFTQKAAAIELDERDVIDIESAAAKLVQTLNENPTLADPEVPKTIAFIQRFLSSPGTTSKRAAFAMIRTIENLLSAILRHTLSFFDKTAEKIVDGASTVSSRIITGLLGLALMSAVGIGPAAVRAGAPWVKQAAEIVQKQIEKQAER